MFNNYELGITNNTEPRVFINNLPQLQEMVRKHEIIFFLDRDGVINKNPPEKEYILLPEQLTIISEAAAFIAKLNHLGIPVVIITNQRCIALKKLTFNQADGINTFLNQQLGLSGAHIDGFVTCPHDHNECSCRKPKPGMFLTVKKLLCLDLTRCFMIGNMESDCAAAIAAGIPAAHTKVMPTDGDLLSEAVDLLYILESLMIK